MFRGFRDFILRGSVIDLAVAVVMGVAFAAVVNSVVKNLITPLIALAGGAPDFSEIRTGPLLWGNILNDVLTFLITAAVVYFVIVLPVKPCDGAAAAVGATATTDTAVPGVPERHSGRGASVRPLHGATLSYGKLALNGGTVSDRKRLCFFRRPDSARPGFVQYAVITPFQGKPIHRVVYGLYQFVS